MNEKNNLPDDARLSALLRESRAMPGLPPRFQQNVWRRIEDAEAPVKSASWADALVAMVLRPRFALATAAGLLGSGVFAGTAAGRHISEHDAEMNYLASVAPASVR